MLANVINYQNLIILVSTVIITLFSIAGHELAHGYAAYLCGDDTAKIYGRLTLNPLKHIDWIGAVCLAVFRFGWAKPVPVNFHNLKNKKRDIVIVSLAGPFMNFAIAFIATLVLYLSVKYNFATWTLYTVLINVLQLNLGLGVFNLIPLPPLDGSKVVGVFLKNRTAYKYFSFEKYGTLVLLLIFIIPFFGNIFSNILSECVNGVYYAYIKIIQLSFKGLKLIFGV